MDLRAINHIVSHSWQTKVRPGIQSTNLFWHQYPLLVIFQAMGIDAKMVYVTLDPRYFLFRGENSGMTFTQKFLQPRDALTLDL